jgi:hypothetical protein
MAQGLAAGLPARRPSFDPGASPRGICGGQSGTAIDFPRLFCSSPVNYIPSVLHY